MLGGYDLFKEAKVRRFYARQPDSKARAALFGHLYPYMPNIQAQSVAMRRSFFHTRPQDLADPFFSHLPRWKLTAQLKRFFSPDFLPPGEETEPFGEVMPLIPKAFAGWPPFCQAQYLETMILLPGYILSSQGDRAAMANSVEGRFPFLDHRLAEFAARLPVRWKMKGLDEKYLLKRALGELVPETIAARKKQPYRAPDAKSFFTADWQRAREDYVEELLSPERLQADGVFQSAAVGRLLTKMRDGKAISVRDNMALVGILSTQILVEQFVRRAPSASGAGLLAPTWKQPEVMTQPSLAGS
jgi:asparagine synthase (glutamine-hydrolysing)